MATDLILAAPDRFDEILQDVENLLDIDYVADAGLTIDDVVSIVAIYRDAIADRSAWWKIRRQVYGRFASHETITSRTLAAIPDPVRDEIAGMQEQDLEAIVPHWLDLAVSAFKDPTEAKNALTLMVDTCHRAKNEKVGVMLRTNQPPNDFEQAFGRLVDKRRQQFQRAFESWDESKKHEAHQRYNYYLKQNHGDCLERVLRDFTRPKTSRINLKTDQRKVDRYLLNRIKSFAKSLVPDEGESGMPLTGIGLIFDVEYEGCVECVFDSRPRSGELFDIIEGTEHRLELYHWQEALERFSCDGLALKMTLLNDTKLVIQPESDEYPFETLIGDMLRDTLIAAFERGEFSHLSLARDCVFYVGGTHTEYFWQSKDENPKG